MLWLSGDQGMETEYRLKRSKLQGTGMCFPPSDAALEPARVQMTSGQSWRVIVVLACIGLWADATLVRHTPNVFRCRSSLIRGGRRCLLLKLQDTAH